MSRSDEQRFGAGRGGPLGRLTDDDFLGGRLKLLQPEASYRSGIDAVLLAASVPAGGDRRQRVLDAGAGVGVAGLCVAWRCTSAALTLLERDARLAAIARLNVERNLFSDRVAVVEADLLEPGLAARQFGNGGGAFEHALANPPHHVEGAGTAAPDAVKAAANAMPAGTLDRWVRFLAGALVPGGTVTLIHRADALEELLSALGRRFGAAKVLPIHPRAGEPAKRVLIQAVKASGAPLTILPGLVLHGAGNGFEPSLERVLREGAALAIGRPP